MIELPLLDEEYRDFFLYRLDQINTVMTCSANKLPWFPKDEDRLETSIRVYSRWHPDPDKNTILNFPWPKPGEIPQVAADFLKPTEKEKKKVQTFIDDNDGPDMDPLTEMIVRMAKDLTHEVY